MSPTRRDFIKATAAVTAGVGLNAYAAEGEGGSKPNLLFVFTDQQSFDMLGCYGNDQIQTPNLDRLAKEGVRFEYCISSNPVCTPMRGMLLSGQHPLKNGAFSNDIAMFPGKGQYFGEVMGDNGYRTGYVGKWHLYGGNRDRAIPAGPYRYGFDDVFLSNNCALNYDPGVAFYYDQKTGRKIKFNEWEVYGQTKQAEQFIKDAPADKPWALMVSWHPPHDHKGLKYTTLPELEELYDPAKIKLRPSQKDTPEVRKDMQGYMAMCTGCDIAFGRLMETLKKRGMDDNTIVVFTSDHGDLHDAHGRPWAKSFPEDLSCRVPLIIRYPKKLRPRKSNLLVGTLDLMPTILGMMGLPVPEACDGQDLTQHIVSRNDDAVASVPLFYYAPSWRGVFTRDFTYSERCKDEKQKPEEGMDWNTLYDRKKDPHQLKNEFGNADYAAKQTELKALMHKWLTAYEDPFVSTRELTAQMGLKHLRFHGKRAEGQTGRLPGRPVDILKKNKVRPRY